MATGGDDAMGGRLNGNTYKRAVGESPESAIALPKFEPPAPVRVALSNLATVPVPQFPQL